MKTPPSGLELYHKAIEHYEMQGNKEILITLLAELANTGNAVKVLGERDVFSLAVRRHGKVLYFLSNILICKMHFWFSFCCITRPIVLLFA